jgi:hypothetical protein
MKNLSNPFYDSILETMEVELRSLSLDDTKDQKKLKILEKELIEIKLTPKKDVFNFIERFNAFSFSTKEKNIEKEIIISKKEWKQLNLPKYVIPRIYQHIPRCYNRYDKKENFIQSEFRNIKDLKRCYIDKALLFCYDKVEIVDGKITLFTWVMPDGIGDLLAQYKTAKIINKKYPSIEISLVVLIKEEEKIPKEFNEFQILIHRYKIIEKKIIDKQKFSSEILQKLRESEVVFQLPTYYPYTEELKKQIEEIKLTKPLPNWELLGEYGFIKSKFFSPRSISRSMGLHFLEKGIFIEEKVRKKSLDNIDEISNKTFLFQIFGKKCLKRSEIKRYKEANKLFIAYLKDRKGYLLFLYTIISYLKKDTKNIDICLPNLGLILKDIESLKDSTFLKDHDISQLILHIEGDRCILPISSSGKILRLIQIPKLDFSDFHLLQKISENIIGCCGNQSISEAISLDKIIFYELQSHTRFFIKDFLALAEKRIKNFPTSCEYIKLLIKAFGYDKENEALDDEKPDLESIGKRMGDLLSCPETTKGMHKLNKIIQNEFLINHTLSHIIARSQLFYHFPHLKEKEGEIVNSYLNKEKSLKNMLEEVKILLSRD